MDELARADERLSGSSGPPPIPTRVKPPERKPTARERIQEAKKATGQTPVPAGLPDQLQEKLVEYLLFAPTTAQHYGTVNSAKAVSSMLELGQKYPPVMKALVKFAASGNAYYVLKYVAGIVLAIRIDMEGLNPDMRAAKWLGVTNSWDATHDRAVEMAKRKSRPGNIYSENERQRYDPPFTFVPVSPDWNRPGFNSYDGMGRYQGPFG